MKKNLPTSKPTFLNHDSHWSSQTGDPFYRQIIDSLEDYALFTIDASGFITSWNSGAERLFGYSEKDIIGKSGDILFVAEDRKKNEPRKEMNDAVEKGRGQDHKWHLKKDGTKLWVSGLLFPLKDESGMLIGFTKIARDLTKQKRYEEERRALLEEVKSEKKKLIDVFERAPAFMAILQGKDHVFEMANAAYYQLVGHREIVGKSLSEALPEVVEQGFIKILDTVLRTGKPFIGNELAVSLQREKNSPVEQRFVNFVYEPLKDIRGKKIGIVAHGYDVTEQVVAREKIAESELRYRTIFNTIDEGFCIIEMLFDNTNKPIDYRFLETNPIFEKQTGLENPIGKTAKQLVPNLEPHWFERYGNVVLTGESIRFMEGSEAMGRWFDVYASRVGGPESRKIALVFNDITKRRHLERQKDEFLGIASHELKTPVTSIKAYGQVLEAIFRRKGDLKSADLLLKMDAQVNRLNNLIGDLLDVTKIQAGRLQFNEDFFDFNDLVADTVEELQRTTDKHTIVKKLEKTKIVYGDRERIGQVITNLITNAIKYSPHADKINVAVSGNTNQVTVCVEDFGVGIAKDKQEKVFEQFYRVSGEKQHTFPGLGLGLYISSEIIKREGGKIWVESAKGKGSTFCFSLPILKRKTKQQDNVIRNEEVTHE